MLGQFLVSATRGFPCLWFAGVHKAVPHIRPAKPPRRVAARARAVFGLREKEGQSGEWKWRHGPAPTRGQQRQLVEKKMRLVV